MMHGPINIRFLCQGLNYVSKDNLTLNVPQDDIYIYIYISSSIIFNILMFLGNINLLNREVDILK